MQPRLACGCQQLDLMLLRPCFRQQEAAPWQKGRGERNTRKVRVHLASSIKADEAKLVRSGPARAAADSVRL